MFDIHDACVQEALIGRPACDTLTKAERRAYADRRVLVTGAGGSVGSELVRRLAACGPSRLTLVDQSEYNLFRIERQLAASWPGLRVDGVLGDVTRPRVIQTACATARPDVVFHAAAYKHVTMLERDVCAGIEANVFGTLATLRAAKAVNARFVLISSDKAVNPHSVMGATKRLAELVALGQMDNRFRPVIVRFGNVLGSSGSVLELMADCLQRGAAIPVTDVEATRFFMTAGEAATLVLRADLLRLGGEICWLDMGRPVRILDIANRLNAMAETSGLAPVPVTVIGLRPGEKLDEELTVRGMKLSRTDHARVWIAEQSPVDTDVLHRTIRALRVDVSRGDGLSALADLCAAVPEYRPSADARQAAGSATLAAPYSTEEASCRLVA
jgi:FlaA1/EpsC-like NDP-sugar epimerase